MRWQTSIAILLLGFASTALGQGIPTAGKAPDPTADLPLGNPAFDGRDLDLPNDEEDEDSARDKPLPTLYGEELLSANDTIIYVIDTSCSMAWEPKSYTTADGQTKTGDRMERAKAELIRSVSALSENFLFNMIAYECSHKTWQRDMVEANAANKQSAIGWIQGLYPLGGTATGPATAAALFNKDNMLVVLLTDGAPNCGANGMSGHRQMIKNANSQRATVNVFGIAATGEMRTFCQNVAADNNGTYYDVP